MANVIFCTILAAAFGELRLEKLLLVLMAVCFVIGTELTPYYRIIVTSNGILRQFVRCWQYAGIRYGTKGM